jgi:hypothetical protein
VDKSVFDTSKTSCKTSAMEHGLDNITLISIDDVLKTERVEAEVFMRELEAKLADARNQTVATTYKVRGMK